VSDHEFTLSISVEINSDEVKASSVVVPYQDWGMKDPSNFGLHVEGKVSLNNVSALGHLTNGNLSSAKH
jgi:hypothetical protein